MTNNDCHYCTYGYYAGDDLLCSKMNKVETCKDYELDDYFVQEIIKFKQEVKDGMNK